jgi:two-component system response regulator CpxR
MKETTPEGITRLLIVDDDRKLCALLEEFLAPFGYQVESAFTGPDGLRRILQGGFNAVILDVMLPGMDGFEVLKLLRRESDVPVLMLTSRGDETDRIVGLEIGADDYLPKTFSTRELLARLRAVTRRAVPSTRAAGDPSDFPIIVGSLRIDPASHTATLGDRALDLTPHEYGLLLALARAQGRVLTRNHLLNQIAGRGFESFDRSVDVHISNLRRKLGDDPKSPRFIRTMRSAGYMLVPLPLDRPESASAPARVSCGNPSPSPVRSGGTEECAG